MESDKGNIMKEIQQDLVNVQYLKLKSIIKETSETCDGALEGCHKIQSANQRILTWIKWLQSQSPIAEITASNTSMISQLEFLKKHSVLHAVSQVKHNINDISNLIARFSERLKEARAIKSKVLELTHTYIPTYDSTQQERGFEGSSYSGETPNLDNRFSTALSQSNQSCIDVLASLISLLRAEHTLGNTATSSSNCEVDKLKSSIRSQPEMQQVPKKRVEEDSVPLSSICKKARTMTSEDAIELESRAVEIEKSIPQQPSTLAPSNFYQKLSILLREETCKCKLNEEVPKQSISPAQRAHLVMANEVIDLLEIELGDILKKFQKMEKKQTESDARLKNIKLANAQLISTKQKLIEEARLANQRAEKVETEMTVTISQHNECTAKVTDLENKLKSALEYRRMYELLKLRQEMEKLDLEREKLMNSILKKPRNQRRRRNRRNRTFN